MEELEYAEQFHIQPQEVRRTVKAAWWTRWRLARLARLARRAYEASQQVEDWTRDLTPAARAAMRWCSIDSPQGGE